jgi:alpha-L-arabinofuranosidase
MTGDIRLSRCAKEQTMKRVLLGALLLAAWGVAWAGEATLTVQVDQPGVKVSPLLYGIFFEEINRAGDGGIYAELVQNRSFEDAATPVAWTLVKGADAEGSLALDKTQPLNAHNPTSLKLDIVKGRVGIANNGFAKETQDGIAVQAGKAYDLTLYARGGGELTASLEKQDGTVLAVQKIAGLSADWQKFQCLLTANATVPNARLVIAAEQPGTVWLDMVSLMPRDGYKGHPFRADLAQKLADMRPAFVRFPGGCYVEGNKLAEAFRWKQTIGDIAARPGHWNLWGYMSNDGLGYHEYLQLCEDIGAAPLYVINCGMSHEEQNKKKAPPEGAELQEYVQDALDAIEYANGPVDSKWGALRVAAGHPAPFNLHMMEIGNENGGPVYNQHFALFHDAIKAKYPDFQLVSDVWGGLPGERKIDIADEHYYNSPEFFLRNADKYDKYDRAGHKVYVGEYAVTKNCGRGNLAGAIGEAAFMTGMERNSDVVVMASYAPLFEYVGWKHWNPNAILFDGARSYGTPSWQVQTLFGRNRADIVLPLTLTAPATESTETRGGKIGLGTWNTQAEFKDIKVTQGNKVLFVSDFAKNTKGWKFTGGDWQTADGALRQSAKGTDLRAYAGQKEWKDYTLTLKARKLGGAEGFLIIFAAPNEKDKAWWNLGGWGNQGHAVEMRGVEHDRVPGQIETGRWYDIKIELQGSRIRCWLDGQLVHDIKNGSLKSMYAVAGLKQNTHEIILKVVNAAGEAMDTALDLKGAPKLAPTGTAVVLTSADPNDENSFDEPTKVAPQEETVPVPGASFRHTFPAHSVTVLRLKQAE